jgi:hypothetical protein
MVVLVVPPVPAFKVIIMRKPFGSFQVAGSTMYTLRHPPDAVLNSIELYGACEPD